jgi:hypothetical protein
MSIRNASIQFSNATFAYILISNYIADINKQGIVVIKDLYSSDEVLMLSLRM